MNASGALLSLNISAHYNGRPDVLRDVSLELESGEILGLVGQSGSGKSTLTLAILGLLAFKGGRAWGQVWFRGRDLMSLHERQLREIRGREIALVLQSPLSALNPALRIGTQLIEAWKAHRRTSKAEALIAIEEALHHVSLPHTREFLRRFPSQLSIGQAQRVLVAMAVLHKPALLIADEPTSALDLITQSEVLDLFRQLNRDLGTGILYISHDLLSVAAICDRIAILHEGSIVECGTAEQIFRAPQHEYTKRLVDALPQSPLSPTYSYKYKLGIDLPRWTE